MELITVKIFLSYNKGFFINFLKTDFYHRLFHISLVSL